MLEKKSRSAADHENVCHFNQLTTPIRDLYSSFSSSLSRQAFFFLFFFIHERNYFIIRNLVHSRLSATLFIVQSFKAGQTTMMMFLFLHCVTYRLAATMKILLNLSSAMF